MTTNRNDRSRPDAPTQQWPKIWASPATWEAGTVAHRTGRMPNYSRHAATARDRW